MRKIAFDTNVVLDALCSRKDAAIARKLLMAVAEDRAVGVLTANAVTDIYYISRKYIGSDAAREAVRNLITLFDIAAVDAEVCGEAAYSEMDDFEDAVFVCACRKAHVECIVTRDQGLLDSPYRMLEACTPEEMLRSLQER